VAKLKERPGGELQVHGSGQLAQTLIDHDLVDEYRLLTLSRASRLREEEAVSATALAPRPALRLTSTSSHEYRASSSRLTSLMGPARYGSFA